MIRPEINVTPLIDILLVLLIIFMIVTPQKLSRFEARVPSEPRHDSPADPHPHTLVVSIGRDLAIDLNGERTGASTRSADVLSERLRQIFAERARNGATSAKDPSRVESTVFIKAPKSISYGNVAFVVDAVKAAGADPVSLQIDGLL
ncbi:MAG: biopolymer transporter ExbD [Pyrinomonadaceae bacterium]|nr:biopolymer transporter ExbD [Pyrinomonadaceae bacterium]